MEKEPARTIPFEEAKPVLIGQIRNAEVNDLLQTAEDKAVAALRKDPAHPEKAAADSKAQIFNVASYRSGRSRFPAWGWIRTSTQPSSR